MVRTHAIDGRRSLPVPLFSTDGCSQGASFNRTKNDAAKNVPVSLQGGRVQTAWGGSAGSRTGVDDVAELLNSFHTHDHRNNHRLIEQPLRPLGSGFRVYPEETVEQIRFIRQAQEIGFSLREIDELLSLRADPSASSSDVRERAIAKREEVERKIAHLQKIHGALEELISACPGKGALRQCSIMEALISASRSEAAAKRPNRKETPE